MANVRAGGSERVVGSWQAGSPDEALAFYRRKYEGLETEVTLLEQRISTTDLSEAGDETLVKYSIDANITGKLGSMGQPVLKSKAKDMEQKFAEKMRAAFAGPLPGSAPGAAS